jgi:hypothetical protein
MEFTAQDSDTLTAKYPRWTNAMNTDQLLEHAAGVVKRRRREYGEPADLSSTSPRAGH